MYGLTRPRAAKRAEPEIPLALARTGEKVASSQAGVDDAGQAGYGPVFFGPILFWPVLFWPVLLCPVFFWPVWPSHLQVFQVVRVVDVDGHGLVGVPQLFCHIDEALGANETSAPSTSSRMAAPSARRSSALGWVPETDTVLASTTSR